MQICPFGEFFLRDPQRRSQQTDTPAKLDLGSHVVGIVK